MRGVFHLLSYIKKTLVLNLALVEFTQPSHSLNAAASASCLQGKAIGSLLKAVVKNEMAPIVDGESEANQCSHKP